eukprot:TRINITY_DN11261_c0_g1_i1.p1 TRINITY_DN11261_c0_g1~~TRINITY_DN11261_c0_g1_i1.p1  ORF type:complete len:353 (+),score=98.39 TRINITY_DN11261_c0_g1_i1:271-1329(+)
MNKLVGFFSSSATRQDKCFNDTSNSQLPYVLPRSGSSSGSSRKGTSSKGRKSSKGSASPKALKVSAKSTRDTKSAGDVAVLTKQLSGASTSTASTPSPQASPEPSSPLKAPEFTKEEVEEIQSKIQSAKSPVAKKLMVATLRKHKLTSLIPPEMNDKTLHQNDPLPLSPKVEDNDEEDDDVYDESEDEDALFEHETMKDGVILDADKNGKEGNNGDGATKEETEGDDEGEGRKKEGVYIEGFGDDDDNYGDGDWSTFQVRVVDKGKGRPASGEDGDEWSTMCVSNVGGGGDEPKLEDYAQIRELEEWEINILALERGEFVESMGEDDGAFRRWQKKRSGISGLFGEEEKDKA